MALSNAHHPSPMPLISARLWFNETGTNYREWKTSTLYLIHHQGLVHFIDGSSLLSTATDNVWKRTDEPLKQGILSLLEKDVAEAVKHLSTSREIWLELEAMFREKHSQEHSENEAEDWNNYSPDLYRAVKRRLLTIAKGIFDNTTGAIEAKINSTHTTALHIAVEAGEGSIAIGFFTKLVEALKLEPNSNELLAAKDAIGSTALNTAAAVGNKSAASILVLRNPDLVYTPNVLGDFPVHTAAKHAKRSMLKYLISVTKDDRDRVDQKPYVGLSGLALLISTIQADFFDIALFLVKKYPCLAGLKLSSNSALKSIAGKKFMYENNKLYIPSDTTNPTLVHGEDFASDKKQFTKSRSILNRFRPDGGFKFAWAPFGLIHQPVIGEPVGELVVEILQCLCKEIKKMSVDEAVDIYRDPILIAAKLGNTQVVEQIIEAFPNATYCSNPASFQNIFQVAVENRALRVFNLIYKMVKHTHLYLDLPDVNGNNLLHLAAKLAPSHKLAGLPNVAFQMQHEIQWYKRVEKLVHPHCREQLNYAGKSPRMIFLEEHKELREVGEKWVKDTVNSCAITAALISTIFFAAAITVPGGSDSNNGFPLFLMNSMFTFFAVSNAISLIASATSLLIFLDLSTSRYTEEDFLSYIPARLLIGMHCLIISITFMMLTFSVTIFLVFGRNRHWVLGLVFVVAGYILVIFYAFQLTFLNNMLNLTLSGIFGVEIAPRRPTIGQLLLYGNKYVRDRRSASHEFI